jgi:hypothetical protein
MASLFCQKCGSPNQAGAQFCSKCGATLAVAPPPPPTTQVSQGGAAPASPGTKKSRAAVIATVSIVVVVVILLGLYAAGVFSPSSSSGGGGSTPSITITGFTFTPDYTGTTSGYLASSYTCASGCPLQVATGGTLTITLDLVSSATTFNHNIDDFTVTGGFSVISVSPSLPVTLAPGGSQVFTLTIQTPSVSGSYSISGTIVTN